MDQVLSATEQRSLHVTWSVWWEAPDLADHQNLNANNIHLLSTGKLVLNHIEIVVARSEMLGWVLNEL